MNLPFHFTVTIKKKKVKTQHFYSFECWPRELVCLCVCTLRHLLPSQNTLVLLLVVVFFFVCVCACVRACVRVCVCVPACVLVEEIEIKISNQGFCFKMLPWFYVQFLI